MSLWKEQKRGRSCTRQRWVGQEGGEPCSLPRPAWSSQAQEALRGPDPAWGLMFNQQGSQLRAQGLQSPLSALICCHKLCVTAGKA